MKKSEFHEMDEFLRKKTGKELPYGIPDNYWESFDQKVFKKVSASSFSDTAKKYVLPFEAEPAYFDNLEASLLQKIKEKHIHKSKKGKTYRLLFTRVAIAASLTLPVFLAVHKIDVEEKVNKIEKTAEVIKPEQINMEDISEDNLIHILKEEEKSKIIKTKKTIVNEPLENFLTEEMNIDDIIEQL